MVQPRIVPSASRSLPFLLLMTFWAVAPLAAQTNVTLTYDALSRTSGARSVPGNVDYVYDAAGHLVEVVLVSAAPFTVSPAWGDAFSSTTLVARGLGFSGGVTIAIDGVPVLPALVRVLDDTTATFPMRMHAPGWVSIAVTLSNGTTLTLPRGFAYLDESSLPTDSDGDGMSDNFEAKFGFDSALASDGQGDADGDGRTNAQEALDGTHPRGLYTRYLAEGAQSAFIGTYIALANPNDVPAVVVLRFLRKGTTPVTHVISVPPTGRAGVAAVDVPGLGAAEFSTVIESDQPVIADRTMQWAQGIGYGSHAESSQAAPSLTWYLAEGSTKATLDLWYLLQNPSLTTDATVRVTYLRPDGLPPIVAADRVVLRSSRDNIHVDEVPGLESTDVSAIIEVTNGVPILVERALYANGPRLFEAGHDAAGVTAPSTSWFLAEGATGPMFDEFILLANPTTSDTVVRVTYLLSWGAAPCSKDYALAAQQRQTIWVNYEECPTGSGLYPFSLAELSATVTSLNPLVPILVERAMWWPQSGWIEGHDAAGTTTTGTRWGLADGAEGFTDQYSTWILIANTSPFPGTARVTLLYEDGTTESRDVVLGANSRTTVSGAMFTRAPGRRFGAVIESVSSDGSPPAQIVVERAMYASPESVFWATGTNVVATKLQ